MSENDKDQVVIQIDQNQGIAVVGPSYMPIYNLEVSSALGHREAAARAMIRMAQMWLDRAQKLQRGELALSAMLMEDDPAPSEPDESEPIPDLGSN